MPSPLPVTLVTGFLGAGKTSLLHHLVSEHTGGHLALLLEKTGEIDFDAKAMRGLAGAMGRRNDVVEEIDDAAELAAVVAEIAAGARHERIVMEVGGLTLGSYWERALHGLEKAARIENVVAVVDLLDWAHGGAGEKGGDAARNFQQAQIEAASIIVAQQVRPGGRRRAAGDDAPPAGNECGGAHHRDGLR